MAVNWDKLESDIRDYMQTGANDPKRTSVQTAKRIEDLYILAVEIDGKNQFGQEVLTLPSGPFATALAAKFADNVGVVPSVNPAQMAADKTKQLTKTVKVPGQPAVPTNVVSVPKPKLPSTNVSIPKPPIPGVPSVNISVKIPQIPSPQGAENNLRKAAKLQQIPAPPPTPAISASDLVKAANPPKGPAVPNPAATQAKVATAVKNATSRVQPLSPQAQKLMPQIPTTPNVKTPAQLGIKIPVVPVDTNLAKMNATGTNGILLTWLGATMNIASFPPGFATVYSNNITSPGSYVPMNCALGGPDFATEVVKSLKAHAKTVTGLDVGQTPNGSPISVPWVGIS